MTESGEPAGREGSDVQVVVPVHRAGHIGQGVVFPPSWRHRAVTFFASAVWWSLIALLPLAAVAIYSNIWTLGMTACDESFGHYAGDGFAYLFFLVVGVPAAYLLQGVALYLGRSRSRTPRLFLVITVLALCVLLALSMTVPNVLSPGSAC